MRIKNTEVLAETPVNVMLQINVSVSVSCVIATLVAEKKNRNIRESNILWKVLEVSNNT
jgi:hypothetical protein